MVGIRYYLILVAACLVTAGTVQAQSVEDNLVHAWTFEDGTMNDQVGSAHGTPVGDIDVVDGSLMGLGGWLELPGEEIAINTFDEITLEILYTPAEGMNTGYTMLVYFGTTTGNLGTDYLFLSAARGDNVSRAAISIGVEGTPWTGEDGANGPEYDDGQLHHMVATLSNEGIRLYMDGTETGSMPLRAENFISGISTDFAYLARGGYVDDPPWLGFIHEFKIYNRILTVEEVAELYAVATSVEEATQPERISLAQNYPNPFNPVTTIGYTVAQSDFVTLAVYDLLGNLVTTLVNEQKSPGYYEVAFDGANLASGVYVYRMSAGNYHQARTLTLIK